MEKKLYLSDSIILCMHTQQKHALYFTPTVFFFISFKEVKSSKNEENVKLNENHQFLKSLYPPKYQYSGLSYEPGYEWQI